MEENPYAPPTSDIEQLPQSEHQLASRSSRLFASILDSISLMVIWIPLVMISGFWDNVASGQTSQEATIVFALIGTVIFLAINGYFLHTRGQSLGKMALKIQIVRRDTGQIPSLGRIVGLRMAPVWLVSMIPLVGDFATLIDALFIFRRDRLCLHDMIAHTCVIEYQASQTV